MKLMILLSMLSFSVFGSVESARPLITLSTFPTQVQVRINNYSNFDYTCSGPVYMTLANGSRRTQYYFGRIQANRSDWKVIYPGGLDRIVYARHAIFCR